MISRQDILERAAERKLRPEVVEKDYVLGWLLSSIGHQADAMDPATRKFEWTPDSQAADLVVKGAYELSGDEMALSGQSGSDDLNIILRRASGEPN